MPRPPAIVDADVLALFAACGEPCTLSTALGRQASMQEADAVLRLWSDGRLLREPGSAGKYSVNPSPPPAYQTSRGAESGYGAAASNATRLDGTAGGKNRQTGIDRGSD